MGASKRATNKTAIADMMTRIRNATLAGRERTTVPLTKTTLTIAQALKAEGSIFDFYEVITQTSRYLVIILKPQLETRRTVIIKRMNHPPLLRVGSTRRKRPFVLRTSNDPITTELQDEDPAVRRKAVQELGKIISDKEV